MNLKEAFRFQNRIQGLMNEAQNILSRDQNVTETKIAPERALKYKVSN